MNKLILYSIICMVALVILAVGLSRVPDRRNGTKIAAAVFVFLLLLGAVHIYHPRFDASSPSRIEMRVWDYEENREYRTTITDPSACSSVVSAFRLGTIKMPCMCKYIALFQVHHEDGSVDNVHLLPGHAGPESCALRMGLLHYRISRKNLFQIMNSAGIDTSKIPAY